MHHILRNIFFAFMCLGFMQCTHPKIDDNNSSLNIATISNKIENSPNDHNLLFERAKMYIDSTQYNRAIKDIQKAIELDSLQIPYYLLLSEAYIQYYNPAGAIKTLHKALSINPDNIETHYKIAHIKYILQDYDGSILALNTLIRIDPQNAKAYLLLGLNMKAIQEEQRCINALMTAVELDNKLTDAWLLLGEIHENKNDKKALTFYESAILSDPTSPQALHAKAYFLQNHHQIPDAIKIYKSIFLLDSLYMDAYLNLGLLYVEQDSFQTALQHFDRMIYLQPQNPDPYYYKAKVYKILREDEKAKRYFEKASALQSTIK